MPPQQANNPPSVQQAESMESVTFWQRKSVWISMTIVVAVILSGAAYAAYTINAPSEYPAINIDWADGRSGPDPFPANVTMPLYFNVEDPEDVAVSIDWGDGEEETVHVVTDPANTSHHVVGAKHIWSSAGTYTVRVTARNQSSHSNTVSFPVNILPFGATSQKNIPIDSSKYDLNVDPTIIPREYVPYVLNAWRLQKYSTPEADPDRVTGVIQWDFDKCAADPNKCDLAYDPATDTCRNIPIKSPTEPSGEYYPKQTFEQYSICRVYIPYSDHSGGTGVVAAMGNPNSRSLYSVAIILFAENSSSAPTRSELNAALGDIIGIETGGAIPQTRRDDYERQTQGASNPIVIPSDYELITDHDVSKQIPYILEAWRIAKKGSSDSGTVIQLLQRDFEKCASDPNRCYLPYDPTSDKCKEVVGQSGYSYWTKQTVGSYSVCKISRPYTDFEGSANVSAVLAQPSSRSLYMLAVTQWGTA